MALGPAPGRPVILVIGLDPDVGLPGFDTGAHQRVDCRVEAVNDRLLADLAPVLVLTALFVQGGDAGLVAQTLARLGYRGTLRVLCPALPNPAMILREMRAMAPGVKIDLVQPS